jgi:hypothetical protein
MMVSGFSAPLSLTWIEDGKTVGVSAPLEVWISQIVLSLPSDIQSDVMDNVIAEIERLNELQEAEREKELEEVTEEVVEVMEETPTGPTGDPWHDQVLADHAAEEEDENENPA